MSKEMEFVDGMIVKAPSNSAPEFVKCSISIKRKELGNWLRSKDEDWINIDVRESKGGKWYAAVNDFKPDSTKASPASQPEASQHPDFDDSTIPS